MALLAGMMLGAVGVGGGGFSAGGGGVFWVVELLAVGRFFVEADSAQTESALA